MANGTYGSSNGHSNGHPNDHFDGDGRPRRVPSRDSVRYDFPSNIRLRTAQVLT